MGNISIGDFVCLKNHPYTYDNNFIKISANADMIPPIMVISEILNKDEYDTVTGKLFEKQFKCIYYSHKDGKYQDKWIKESQIKLLKPIKSYLNLYEFNSIENYDLEFLKDKYVNELVCLKNVDFELNKKKVFIDSSNGKRTEKENNHLDFLPPVMTIVDIVKNKEEKKFSSRNAQLEKACSKYLFKCKWYNHKTTTYSEEFIPSNILGLIINQNIYIDFFKSFLNDRFVLILQRNNNISIAAKTLANPKEIIFNHYYYKLNYFDYLQQKISSISLSDIRSENSNLHFNTINLIPKKSVFGNNYPSYGLTFKQITEDIFVNGNYFLITYKDKLDRMTKRIIKVISRDYHTNDLENEDYVFIVANCFLRDGNIRHFNLKQITEVTEIQKGASLLE
ncbi:hypothetical protein ODZ84_06990 [Chryseobacterium fluminis]|uniref:hypothetical protein n=1 Tax=Chryseobacterium fluminis TaxID=2983606 RepID=UPI00224D0A0F|nr:hypothetical protein [Chryseobacterium sp. MMS21-Ot14]UZT99310.1 hypothetical protein ODZ84_06990 [Chryseobacterium sp. MMS21-Ot14]